MCLVYDNFVQLDVQQTVRTFLVVINAGGVGMDGKIKTEERKDEESRELEGA